MKFTWLIACATVVCSLTVGSANAAVKYWDLDDSTPGAGAPGGIGTWDVQTSSNWSTSAAGDVAATVWDPGDDAVFAAGNDNAYDVEVGLVEGLTPASVLIEDGRLKIQGIGVAAQGLAIGSGAITVTDGAILQIPNINVIVPGAGHVLVLDNGTLRNTNLGLGIGFYTSPTATPTKIQLGPGGGTFHVPTGGFAGDAEPLDGAYNISLYNGLVEGGTLHKTGLGEFRALNNWTFTELDVQQGLYRINGTGGGETGFGAATGTVRTAGGAVENTSNGAALGTSVTITSPATRSFVLGNTGGSPDTMVVLNAAWTINGPISGPGGLMLNGYARNDGGGAANHIGSQTQLLTLGGTNTYAGATTVNFGTLVAGGGNAIPNTSQVKFSTRSDWGGNLGGVLTTLNTAVLRVNASETVGSIAGGNALRGEVAINGAAVVLSTGADNTTSVFDGKITGSGGLTKVGTGTFTMNGANAYTGDTHVNGGTLSTSTLSLADAADVYLNTGSILNLNFAGTDTIDSLFIDNVAASVGTWGGTGSGATNISPLITGTGLLQVSTSVAPVDDADFDGDGDIDGADFLTWQLNLGATGTGTLATGDANGDTNVTAADLAVWQTQFATATPVAGSVPEPTCVVMLGTALAALAAVRRRK